MQLCKLENRIYLLTSYSSEILSIIVTINNYSFIFSYRHRTPLSGFCRWSDFVWNAGHLALHYGKYLHAVMFHMVVCQMRMCYVKSSKMDLFAFQNLSCQSPTSIACKFCDLVQAIAAVLIKVALHLLKLSPADCTGAFYEVSK